MDNVYFDIFTDGSSYIKGSNYEASSAYAIFINKKKLEEGGKYIIGGTNSQGEAGAVLLALEQLNYILAKMRDIYSRANIYVRVFTDSSFVRESLHDWIYTWSKVGRDAVWIGSNKKPIACQDIFKNVLYDHILPAQYTFSIYHIKGHVSSPNQWYRAKCKFIRKHGLEISDSDFSFLIDNNHLVDEIADTVRKGKLESYRKGSESNCNLQTTGLTRIKRRVKRRRNGRK